MQIPFPFEPMLVFGVLAILLLIGIALRALVPIIQNFLIPSCLIGGLIGLIALALDLIPFEASSFETMAYHFFNISFISVGLTAGVQKKKGRDTGKDYLKGAWWMALMEGGDHFDPGHHRLFFRHGFRFFRSGAFSDLRPVFAFGFHRRSGTGPFHRQGLGRIRFSECGPPSV